MTRDQIIYGLIVALLSIGGWAVVEYETANRKRWSEIEETAKYAYDTAEDNCRAISAIIKNCNCFVNMDGKPMEVTLACEQRIKKK